MACSPATWPEGGPRIQWTGIIVMVVVALWAALVVFVFSSLLAEVHVWLALVTNVVGVGGLTPAVRGWRGRPALRFLALGLGAGVVLGWIAWLASLLAG